MNGCGTFWMILAAKTKVLLKKPCFNVAVSTTNFTQTGLGLNPGLRGKTID